MPGAEPVGYFPGAVTRNEAVGIQDLVAAQAHDPSVEHSLVPRQVPRVWQMLLSTDGRQDDSRRLKLSFGCRMRVRYVSIGRRHR